MADYPILQDLVVVLVVSLATVYLLGKLRVPIIVGFIVAGIVIGPGGLSLIEDYHSIELMAEIGVTLLLFTIGLQFSLQDLFRMKWLAITAGGAQLVLTTVTATVIIDAASSLGLRQSFFLGILIALSSTAIVLRILEGRGESFTVQGRFIIGVLIFQDLAVVPLMLLTLFLGKDETGGWGDAGMTLLESAGFIIGLLVIARYLYPWLMERVVNTRNRELLVLTTILVALGTAWLGTRFGFSLPLGAFLAGIVISESDYSHQILAEITPLRDIFNSIFFVSVGMLVVPELWFENPLLFIGLTIGVIMFKGLVVGGIAMVLGFGTRVAAKVGIGLAQIGEFSFVLASAGLARGVLDGELFSQFLTVSVVTMALTPLLVVFSGAVAERVPQGAWLERFVAGRSGGESARIPRPRFLRESIIVQGPIEQPVDDHVIIVGYGVNGRNVARVLKQIGVRYVILELNPHTVSEGRELGEDIYYGDASRTEVLRHVGIERARALVIAVADPALCRQIVSLGRKENADLHIIARTRFVSEVEHLYRLGADEVIPEEFETSLALAGIVMASYGVSKRAIEKEKASIRGEHYEPLYKRPRSPERVRSLDSLITAEDLYEMRLAADSPVIGQSIGELRLRTRTGVTIIAVETKGEQRLNPGPDYRFSEGDILYLFGRSEELKAAQSLLSGKQDKEGDSHGS